MASIFTGVNPLVHRVLDVHMQLPSSIPTLAEYMYKAGYRTGAVGSNTVLQNASFSRGFMEYTMVPIDASVFPAKRNFGLTILRRFRAEDPDYSSTKKIEKLTQNWLKNNSKQDFFLWIHYFDPHHPFSPPKEYAPPGKRPAKIGLNMSQSLLDSVKKGRFIPSASERAWIKKLYLAEVKYVDDSLGTILSMLKQNRIYDDALIIVASDHGEEFWEHGSIGHEQSVYDEVLWVPLVVKFPGLSKNGYFTPNVSTVQIMPTILNICGIPYAKDSISSTSLLGTGVESPSAIVSTGVPLYRHLASVTFGNMKYVKDLISNREELYDLADDPQEQTSLVKTSPEIAQKAALLLDEFEKNSLRLREFYNIDDFDKRILDDETEQRLRGLGYIQ